MQRPGDRANAKSQKLSHGFAQFVILESESESESKSKSGTRAEGIRYVFCLGVRVCGRGRQTVLLIRHARRLRYGI